MLKQVFISYRHEGPEHARAVRRLAESLRQAGISVALDQFLLLEEKPGGPELGWPKWCEDCANESACVLIVASEGWFAEYEGKGAAPHAGLGAAAEARLFRQDLWDKKGDNTRIRLAFLNEVSAEKVPSGLRAWHQFRPHDGNDQLNALIRWVADCLGLTNVELPTVHWPQPLTDFHPDLANRTNKEWPAIVNLLAGRSRERIMLCEGASGLDKSALIHQAVLYARKLNIAVVRVDLKGGGQGVPAILGQFDLDLGSQLPNFSREGGGKTHLLRKDLRALRQAILVVFNSYEDATDNKEVVNWLNQQFLAEVETALSLAVIVTGQRVPDHSNSTWRDLVLHLHLSRINEIEQWKTWVTRKYPEFEKKGVDLNTLMMFARGQPDVMSSACEAIAKADS